MKINRRKRHQRAFIAEKRMSRKMEKKYQAKGDYKAMKWERWYRQVELKGSASQDWKWFSRCFNLKANTSRDTLGAHK